MNLLPQHKPINQRFGLFTYQKIDSSLKLNSFINQLTKEYQSLNDKSAQIKFIAKNNKAYYSIRHNNNWQDLVEIDCSFIDFVGHSEIFSFVVVYEYFMNYSMRLNKFSTKV